MRKIRVGLKSRSYEILVDKEILSHAGRLIKRSPILQRSVLVVTQKEVAVYYQQSLLESLTQEGFNADFFVTPASKSSEASKSQAVFLKLIKKIASLGGRHQSILLIALGGGVIGDLTGFAASTYRRGVPYVQIPTTLTAQVDSSIGGKTGIDLPEGKNLLGAIYQPALGLSDVSLLSSLPERHWSDGFAEVIKYGVIKDPALFALLEKHGKTELRQNKRKLEKVIFRCAKIKARIVSEDEMDKKGLRMILNFGHTTGHAIESVSGFARQVTHGEAVGIGMLVACDIAEKLGILKDRRLTERLEKTLMKFDLPLHYRGLSVEALLKAMGFDKKSEGGKNRFVLPVSLGKVTIVTDVPLSAIAESLQKRKG